jgi:divalent metal cation (Fe/Co/Zn/Cd) transporter
MDGVIALGVALHILLVGWRLVRNSLLGLMDTAWPLEEQQLLTEILEQFKDGVLTYHAVRTRVSGSLRFVTFHLQVPGDWTVQQGHTLVDRIEAEIRQQLSPVSILIHLEPLEDPASWADTELFRPKSP